MSTFEASHGVAFSHAEQPVDCVSRKITVMYSEKVDQHLILIETQWTADTELVHTELHLAPQGISLLSNALMMILHNRESHRISTITKEPEK